MRPSAALPHTPSTHKGCRLQVKPNKKVRMSRLPSSLFFIFPQAFLVCIRAPASFLLHLPCLPDPVRIYFRWVSSGVCLCLQRATQTLEQVKPVGLLINAPFQKHTSTSTASLEGLRSQAGQKGHHPVVPGPNKRGTGYRTSDTTGCPREAQQKVLQEASQHSGKLISADSAS